MQLVLGEKRADRNDSGDGERLRETFRRVSKLAEAVLRREEVVESSLWLSPLSRFSLLFVGLHSTVKSLQVGLTFVRAKARVKRKVGKFPTFRFGTGISM